MPHTEPRLLLSMTLPILLFIFVEVSDYLLVRTVTLQSWDFTKAAFSLDCTAGLGSRLL